MTYIHRKITDKPHIICDTPRCTRIHTSREHLTYDDLKATAKKEGWNATRESGNIDRCPVCCAAFYVGASYATRKLYAESRKEANG